MSQILDINMLDPKKCQYLGAGSYGVVYRIPKGLLEGSTGNNSWALKLYKPDVFSRAEPAAVTNYLEGLLRLLTIVDEPTRQRILIYSTWPLQIVGSDRLAKGFIMQLIPNKYRESYSTSMRGKTKQKTADATFDFVCQADEKRRELGLPVVSELGRLTLTGHILESMWAFHNARVILGDLSHKNMLIHVDASNQAKNTILFVDADSFRIESSVHPIGQPHSPDWIPPECLYAAKEKQKLISEGAGKDVIASMALREKIQDKRTDVYKICLALFRIFYRGAKPLSVTEQNREAVKEVAHRVSLEIGPEFRDKLLQGLSSDPKRRPSMDEIRDAFRISTSRRK